MELLIPGLILVAIMVWASTRIKRSAAKAFEPEAIETDEFEIKKPEGLLHVLNDDTGLAFRGYSKTFGKVGKKDVRQITVEVSISDKQTLKQRRDEIAGLSESLISEIPYLDGGEKAITIEARSVIDGGEYDVFYKIVSRGKRLFEMRASVLAGHRDENLDRIEELIAGFSVK